MLQMSNYSSEFLSANLPEAMNCADVNDALDMLSDLIDLKGFNEDEEYNDFGTQAQYVYDDLFANND